MGKILALDLGDQWVGTALSDITKIIARPHHTIPHKDLMSFLKEIFKDELIETIIIGQPITMRGTISTQTQKVRDEYEILRTRFPEKNWILWDERLSSKRAQSIAPARLKEEKIKSHSRAAAFILDSYLIFLSLQKNQE